MIHFAHEMTDLAYSAVLDMTFMSDVSVIYYSYCFLGTQNAIFSIFGTLKMSPTSYISVSLVL